MHLFANIFTIALPGQAVFKDAKIFPARKFWFCFAARPAPGLGPEAHLRGFGIIDSFVYKAARDYGEVFYTVKTTFSIKNEP